MAEEYTRTELERLKRLAAEYALKRFIHANMTIGLGTGSTVRHFVDLLAERYQTGGLADISCLSTSEETTKQASALGLPIGSYSALLSDSPLDIAVDGADNINQRKQLIKGGGGALTREKIIAYNSCAVVIIADESKYAPQFSTGTVVPLEVLEIGYSAVIRQLCEMAQSSQERAPLFSAVSVRKDAAHREGSAQSSSIYHTDNGNIILDAILAVDIDDARQLESRLNNVAGVIENGFFTSKKADVVLATKTEARLL